MVKSRTIFLAYCLAISIIFQATAKPAFDIQPPTNELNKILSLTDDAEKAKYVQKFGTDTVKKFIKEAQDAVTEIDKEIEKAEEYIKIIKKESKDLKLEKVEFTKKFLVKFNEAKENLSLARTDLLTLASETILLCQNIEISIKDWQDENAIDLIKFQFKALKELVEKTKTRLATAKVRYGKLIDTWLEMDSNIDEFKSRVETLTDTHSAEYRQWTKNIRIGYITSASAVTVGMVLADIFGCLGICSAVGTTTTWVSVAATAEKAIAKYKGEIEELQTQVDKAMKHFNKLDRTSEGVLEMLNDELALLYKWEAAANNVESTVKNFTPEQVRTIKAYQSHFLSSIQGLKAAAQAFQDFVSKNTINK